MVAQTYRDHFGIVGLVLLQAKHLRGAGLRRNLVRRGMKQLISRTVRQVRHAIHTIANNPQYGDFGSPTCGKLAGCWYRTTLFPCFIEYKRWGFCTLPLLIKVVSAFTIWIGVAIQYPPIPTEIVSP